MDFQFDKLANLFRKAEKAQHIIDAEADINEQLVLTKLALKAIEDRDIDKLEKTLSLRSLHYPYRDVILEAAVRADDVEAMYTILERSSSSAPYFVTLSAPTGTRQGWFGMETCYSETCCSLLYLALSVGAKEVAETLVRDPKTNVTYSGMSSTYLGGHLKDFRYSEGVYQSEKELDPPYKHARYNYKYELAAIIAKRMAEAAETEALTQPPNMTRRY